MMHALPRPLLASLVLILAIIAAPLRAAPIEVVASFSILADLAQQIGGERTHVVTIVADDEDTHGYQPKPSDARRVRDARLVLANGLGFDPWLARLADSVGRRAALVIASDDIQPLARHDAGHGDGDGHAHGARDPHAWQDVARVQVYVRNIAAALARVDPDGAPVYAANAARYAAQLQQLDTDIRAALATLPGDRRKLVTSHDAFGYFGSAYGIEVIAAAGMSPESEPSAAGIARLIRQLRKENIAVVFVENISDPRLIERIAKEGGARLGGKLYSDALSGPDGPASTYIDMMRLNLETLMQGLGAERP